MQTRPGSRAIERRFLEGLRARPDDAAYRLVYADWLEENGATAEAELLRAQLSLASVSSSAARFPELTHQVHHLVSQTDPSWRAAVAFAPPPHDDLPTSLAALYGCLARHQPTGPIAISPFKPREAVAPLEEKSLYDLTADDLGHYAFSALWTMGSKSDFLYFFPRIAELSRRETVGATTWELLAKKTVEAVSDPGDREVIRRFFLALFRDYLAVGDDGTSLLELFTGVAVVVHDRALLVSQFVPPSTLGAALLLGECCVALGGRDTLPDGVEGLLDREETIEALTSARRIAESGAHDVDWDTAEANLLALASPHPELIR